MFGDGVLETKVEPVEANDAENDDLEASMAIVWVGGGKKVIGYQCHMRQLSESRLCF